MRGKVSRGKGQKEVWNRSVWCIHCVCIGMTRSLTPSVIIAIKLQISIHLKIGRRWTFREKIHFPALFGHI